MKGSKATSIHQIPQRVIDRIWDHVDIGESDDCWPWLLSVGSHGYGQIGWGVGDGKSTMTTAHRVVWVATYGPIPVGMTVDHNKDTGCLGGICCNPYHLRLRTNVENATDNGQGRKTHCPKGHPYLGGNLRVNARGWRWCRECQRESNARRTF